MDLAASRLDLTAPKVRVTALGVDLAALSVDVAAAGSACWKPASDCAVSAGGVWRRWSSEGVLPGRERHDRAGGCAVNVAAVGLGGVAITHAIEFAKHTL